MRPLITGRPILESGGPFPLYAHDVRGDVRHAADNGQLGNRLVKGRFRRRSVNGYCSMVRKVSGPRWGALGH